MNYEAERAMNQKRLRMESEAGHGVVQGNGLPLSYMDNGHQIPYQPYAGAYNTHYPPPDAFAAYGPPPPGSYAPQNLSYVPPAHQNYPHHQSFPPQQPPQAQLHMPQTHMVQGYSADMSIHKAWPPQPHLLASLEPQKPLDVKQMKHEIKLEPNDAQKRAHPENDMMGGDLDQPKIKIKTDIFKPDDLAVARRQEPEKAHELLHKPPEQQQQQQVQQPEPLHKVTDEGKQLVPNTSVGDVPPESGKSEPPVNAACETPRATENNSKPNEKTNEEEVKKFGNSDESKVGITPIKTPSLGQEPKKRGRPKGSTNKPKPPGSVTPVKSPTGGSVMSPGVGRGLTPSGRGMASPHRGGMAPRGRGSMHYSLPMRPFRKDFSGIQFRRRWSDDCLDSSHIPNEVYFGDVPVSTEVLFNYYDANAERERLSAQAAQIAAQKAAAAKLAAAKMHARGGVPNEVTTVDSSSSDDTSGSSDSDSEDSDDDMPLRRKPGRPKGSSNKPRDPSTPKGKRGRPPVPPELRTPGITEMKKMCKAAGVRFDYKKLVDGCTKNKERVAKMEQLLIDAGLEGKPTLEKCRALKAAKLDKRQKERQAKKEAKVEKAEREEEEEGEGASSRRMTRGATGVKPRQRIVISSDEEDDTPAARRQLSRLRSSVHSGSESD